MDTDLLLILRMKNGDEPAIEAFVRKYYPAIARYCYLHIRDQGYAEDLTQETFARFFRTLDRYQHYGKAANYLYVIAANACNDYHRKHREITLEELPEASGPVIEPLEEKWDVHMALEKLPPEYREAAILYYFQDQKQAEIAKILGIGLPLVKYRLRKAKELLTVLLGKEDTKP